ncbi:MAG: hypothetical protein R2883_04850 [Caldisericia bacterium]
MRKYISIILSLVLFIFCISSTIVFGGEASEGKRTQTVYSVLGWDGQIKNTSVVNWLRVNTDEKEIIDSPNLKKHCLSSSYSESGNRGRKPYLEYLEGSSSDCFIPGLLKKNYLLNLK